MTRPPPASCVTRASARRDTHARLWALGLSSRDARAARGHRMIGVGRARRVYGLAFGVPRGPSPDSVRALVTLS